MSTTNDLLPTRRCQGPCCAVLPLDAEHFPARADVNPPLDDWCLKCDAKRGEFLDAKAKRDELDAFAASGLKLIAGRIEAGRGVPHSADLVEAFYRAFGGVEGVAQKAALQYLQAAEGSYGRTRILELICRLTVQNVVAGGALKPLEQWTEDEIEAEMQRRFQQAAGRVLDAKFSGPRELLKKHA